jgi:hypothetical protein
MSRTQFSISGLMASVLIAGLGFAALRNASEGWAFATVNLAVAALLFAAFRARFGPCHHRPWWFGFALFGWAHLLFGSTKLAPLLPTSYAAFHLLPREFWRSFISQSYPIAENQFIIVNILLSLAIAPCGATLSVFLASRGASSLRGENRWVGLAPEARRDDGDHAA